MCALKFIFFIVLNETFVSQTVERSLTLRAISWALRSRDAAEVFPRDVETRGSCTTPRSLR